VVDNVCVFGFDNKVKPIAIVVMDEKALRSAIKGNIGHENDEISDLAENKQVKDMVLKDMLASAKAAGLQGIELIAGIIIAPEPWTPANVSILFQSRG